jgi:hypothetical protein
MAGRKYVSNVEFIDDIDLEEDLDHHQQFGRTQITYDSVLAQFIDFSKLVKDKQLTSADLSDENIAKFLVAEGLLFCILEAKYYI